MSAQVIDFSEYHVWQKALSKINMLRKMYAYDSTFLNAVQLKAYVEKVEKELNERTKS